MKYAIIKVWTCMLIFFILPQQNLKAIQKLQKPRVAVVDFDVRVRNVDSELGIAMAEFLTDELFKLGRFRILDRANMKDVLKEQQNMLYGTVDPNTGAQVGKMLGAEYLIVGVLTKFKEKKVGGIGGLIASKLPVGVALFSSELRFGLKIINATTGELMESKTIKKKKRSTGLIATGSLFGLSFGGTFYESKSMEAALEEAVHDAVQMIDAKLPTISNMPDKAHSDYLSDCEKLVGPSAPAIMVVIPEFHIQHPIPDPAGETEIIRILLESDFNLVDQKQIAAIRNQERVINAVNDPQLAAALGVEFGADIIIIGEAFSEFAASQQGRVSCRARVEARAIQTRTGKILAANGLHASAWDVAENVAAKKALREAGNKMATYFQQQLCRKVGASKSAVTSIEILVASTNFKQLRMLEKLVKTLPGIQKVRKKLTGRAGRIFVDFSGTVEDLADVLIDGQTDGLSFEITGFDASKIEVNMGEAQSANGN